MNAFSRAIGVSLAAVLLASSIYAAPTYDIISNKTIQEDAALTVLITNLSDTDGLPVTMSATSSNTVIVPHPTVTGTTLRLAPVNNANGTVTITVTARNSARGVLARTFTVTVKEVNDAPVVINAGAKTTAGSAVLFEKMLVGFGVIPGGGSDEASQTITCKFLALPDSGTYDIFQGSSTDDPAQANLWYSVSTFSNMYLRKDHMVGSSCQTETYQCRDSLGLLTAPTAYTVCVN